MEMGDASTLGDGHRVASTFMYTYPLESPLSTLRGRHLGVELWGHRVIPLHLLENCHPFSYSEAVEWFTLTASHRRVHMCVVDSQALATQHGQFLLFLSSLFTAHRF